MLNIVLLKSKLSLVLAWLKHNWKTVMIGIAIVAMIAFQIVSRNQDQRAIKDLQRALEQSRKDYERAAELHRQEILRRDQIEERYKRVVADLNEKYGKAMADLDKEKRQAIRQIIEETHDEPRVMASRLNMVLGIPLYDNGEHP